MENYNPLNAESKWQSFFKIKQVFKTKKILVKNFIV